MKQVRALRRLVYLGLYTTYVVGKIMIVSAVRGYSPQYSLPERRKWAKHLLWGIGVKIVQDGNLPAAPCLLMCNHRSYLDPVVIMADVLAYPVSKAEVASWPVLGYGARVTGILYLKRESVSSRKKTLAAIGETIRAGWPVIIFPEGTTYDADTTGPLKRGGFQLAANENLPIVPVALEYGEKADAWVGNATFVPHFLSRFGEKRIYARIRYGEPLSGNDPVEMMVAVRGWMDEQLVEFQGEKGWKE
jgi:1-acyl-sn-glycerol-3-phosphate acyltransferase